MKYTMSTIQNDNGGEFVNTELKRYYLDNDMSHMLIYVTNTSVVLRINTSSKVYIYLNDVSSYIITVKLMLWPSQPRFRPLRPLVPHIINASGTKPSNTTNI